MYRIRVVVDIFCVSLYWNFGLVGKSKVWILYCVKFIDFVVIYRMFDVVGLIRNWLFKDLLVYLIWIYVMCIFRFGNLV